MLIPILRKRLLVPVVRVRTLNSNWVKPLTLRQLNTESSKRNKDDQSNDLTKNDVKTSILDEMKSQYLLGKSAFGRVKLQMSQQARNVSKSIQEANKKFAEQELQNKDSRLNFKKDIATGGEIGGLPSEREFHRRKWAKKLELYLDSLQETIFSASRAFNDVTGYSGIQKLRESIDLLQNNLADAKIQVKKLKGMYADAIEKRAESQKQVNELLQRKSTWSTADLEAFTQLYKDDATNVKNERNLKQQVSKLEEEQEKINEELYSAILTRYHEEQIWSDKIRRMSGWSTFMLMGMNLILFLILQLLLEPWKRRRLVNNFENKVKDALQDQEQRNKQQIDTLFQQFDTNHATAATETQAQLPTQELMSEPIEAKPVEPEPVELESEAQLSESDGTAESALTHQIYTVSNPQSAYQWIKSLATKVMAMFKSNLNTQNTFTALELYSLFTTVSLLTWTLSFIF